MRFTASALGLSLALLSVAFAGSALAGPILPADCSVNSQLCNLTPSLLARLGMNAGPTTYESPLGASDSHSISGSLYGVTAYASGTISAGFDGIHTILSATGACTSGCNGYNPGNSEGRASVGDYFGTGSGVPAGAELLISYSVDGFVTNGSNPNSAGLYFGLVVNGFEDDGQCTNGTAFSLNGSFASTCTVLIPVSSLNVISTTLFMNTGVSNPFGGTTTLDASNTAKLTSAILVDSSGNPLPNVQLYDASGYDYDASHTPLPSAVPEPSALLLFATGSLGLAGQLRRRLHSTSAAEAA